MRSLKYFFCEICEICVRAVFVFVFVLVAFGFCEEVLGDVDGGDGGYAGD